MRYTIKPAKNNNPPTIWECLAACTLGAVIGVMFAYGMMGGF